MKKTVSLQERIKKDGLLLLVFGGIAFFLGFSGIGCPFRYVTGIPCPFCGTSRALFSLLSLDFASAWYFHPLFMLAPIFVLLIIDFYNFKTFQKSVIAISILYFVVYLIRLLTIGIP